MPCGILKWLVKKYDKECGAFVLAVLIAFPARFAALNINSALIRFGLFTKPKKFFVE
jgi:hypothetical protein